MSAFLQIAGGLFIGLIVMAWVDKKHDEIMAEKASGQTLIERVAVLEKTVAELKAQQPVAWTAAVQK